MVAEDRTVVVYAAASPAELDQARDLFRAFVTWHRQRHNADQDVIDRYFGIARFEEELAGLPGPYAPPAATASRTSSSSASSTPLRLATAVATSRAVRTCAGSGVKLTSTVAIGGAGRRATSRLCGP